MISRGRVRTAGLDQGAGTSVTHHDVPVIIPCIPNLVISIYFALTDTTGLAWRPPLIMPAVRIRLSLNTIEIPHIEDKHPGRGGRQRAHSLPVIIGLFGVLSGEPPCKVVILMNFH